MTEQLCWIDRLPRPVVTALAFLFILATAIVWLFLIVGVPLAALFMAVRNKLRPPRHAL